MKKSKEGRSIIPHYINLEMKNLIDPQKIKLWFRVTIAIIISAMKIPIRNPNFITFTLITSVPLFFITLIPRLPHIQNQLTLLFIEALEKRKILNKITPKATSVDLSWAVELVIQFLKLYIVDLVNFITALATIYASSTIHTCNPSIGLRDLLKNTITKSRWKDAVFTFTAVSILYDISLPYVVYSIHNQQQLHIDGFRKSLILKSVRVMVPTVTICKWVEYNAWWKLSVVVSILELEEQRGFQAFSTSSQLMKVNKLRGFFLLLILSVRSSGWTTILKGRSCHVSHVAYAFLHASLSCLGKVITWMVFTVYYFDCKNRLQKRMSSTP